MTRAAEKFDPTLGYRFSTYATYWIKQNISRALVEQGRNIKIPVYINEKMSKIKKAERELTALYDREPTDAEIAEKIGYTEKEVSLIKLQTSQTISLEAPIDDDEEECIGALIEDTVYINPADAFLIKDRINNIIDVIDTLPQREANIIKLRFGFNEDKCYTLEETGKIIGLSRERVRQLEKRAIAKLGNSARGKALKELMA